MAFANLRRRPAPPCGFVAVVFAFVAGSAWAQAPAAVTAEMKRLLGATAWQLEYQLSFKASASGNGQSLTGPVSYRNQLSTDATETLSIDQRTDGASLSMQKVMRGTSNPAAAANMQKALMDIVMQTDNIASWLTSPNVPDLGEEPTLEQLRTAALARARSSIGTQTVEYSAESRGDKLFDETGAPYKQIVRTTRRGSGGVTQGSQQITIELNGATKRLLMMVPTTLPTVFEATIAEEVVTLTESPPGSNPSEERKTSAVALESFPGQINITDPTFGEGAVLMIDDPVVLQGGKISGQHTMAGSYSFGSTPTAGTLVVKYTLTPR